MNPVKVRNVEIGTGLPKICVPIVGVTKEAILDAARIIKTTAADVVEWRVDWYEDIFDFEKTAETMKALRDVLGDTPILFTFRTSKEGGEKAIDTDAYVELNQKAAKTGLIDLVDIEAFTGDDAVKAVVNTAHECGVKVVPQTTTSTRHRIKRRSSPACAGCRSWALIFQRSPLCRRIRRMCLRCFVLLKKWPPSMQTVPSSQCLWQEPALSAGCAEKCLDLH